MSDSIREGGCQCGAVRYRISGEPVMAALCHCSMCRRASAAPLVAWAMFEATKVSFLDGPPASYASSSEARREFCSKCGTLISFTANYIPGLIDLTIGSLDDPASIARTVHYWESKRRPWRVCGDELLGSRLLVTNLELRFPIWGMFSRELNYGPLPADAFVFADGGLVWSGSRSATGIRSIGGGVRLNAGGLPFEILAIRALDGPARDWQYDFGFRVGF